MKKPSKKNLKKKCDDLWREIIHEKFYCEVCGKPPSLKENGDRGNHNAHHVITKNNYNLRWDIRNGVNLCVSCHKFGNPSAHGNPLWFAKWLEINRPEDYEYLQNKKFLAVKTWYISDYEEILKGLEEWLKTNTDL